MTMPPPTLQELDEAMLRLAQGDRDAFDVVFRGVWPRMLRLCQASLRDDADAEDAAQAALTRLFEQAWRYDADRPCLSWALSLAWWECRSVHRQRGRQAARTSPTDTDALPAAGGEPGDWTASTRASALQLALEGLSDTDRQTLQATLDEDIPDDPTAQARQRKRRQRALERLRVLWRNLYGD
jgi:RNA polymerase sigma-70 factor (ECF subfamily)